jgi:hypothetical protein
MNATRIYEILEENGCTEDKSVFTAVMQVWMECTAESYKDQAELKNRIRELEGHRILKCPPYIHPDINQFYYNWATPGKETTVPTVTCDTSDIKGVTRDMSNRDHVEKDNNL